RLDAVARRASRPRAVYRRRPPFAGTHSAARRAAFRVATHHDLRGMADVPGDLDDQRDAGVQLGSPYQRGASGARGHRDVLDAPTGDTPVRYPRAGRCAPPADASHTGVATGRARAAFHRHGRGWRVALESVLPLESSAL